MFQLLRTVSEPDITKLFNIDEELQKEEENKSGGQISSLATNKLDNLNKESTIRLAKSLEDINKIDIGAACENQSSSDDSGDDLVEILSTTLKKKIQIETKQNHEIDDDDMSNVRETMLSFLQDSK